MAVVCGLSRDAGPTPTFSRRAILYGSTGLAALAWAQDARAQDDLSANLVDWTGPYGGTPPVDKVTPLTLIAESERVYRAYAREIDAIAAQRGWPTFANTLVRLERARAPLARIDALRALFVSTASSPDFAAANQKLAPARAQLDTQTFRNPALFKRIEAVRGRASRLSPQDARLTEVIYEQFRANGAQLAPAAQARLGEIEGRLSQLQAKFAQNVSADEARLAVFVDREGDLEGLTSEQVATAKDAAARKGRPDAWAIPITRSSVWPVMTFARDRELRRRVWSLWMGRGANAGDTDNRPVMQEILALRAEKARLNGAPSFAHYQTGRRMVGSPERALELITSALQMVLASTAAELEEMQAIANADDGGLEIAASDRLYYRERLRERRLNFSIRDVEPYLTIDTIKAGIIYFAQRAYGLTLRPAQEMATVAPEIEVVEVWRNDALLGLIWFDFFERSGKGPSSWASQYRAASTYDGKVLPLAALHSAAPKPVAGRPGLLPWERANVIFHEFGHALHTIASRAKYPSLGPLSLPWDFIEAPSLFHERWLTDPKLIEAALRRFDSGAPMPPELIAKFRSSLAFDRSVSVTLDYLIVALVDMRLHLVSDPTGLDPMAVESAIMTEMSIPATIDPLLRVQHAFHTFASSEYAAGVYTYLWSDMIAADIGAAFAQTPLGLHDPETNARFFDAVLSAGATVTPDKAFEDFRGRAPDPAALFKQFNLISPA